MPKPSIPDVESITKTNPKVDAGLVAASLQLIEVLRKAGVGKADYSLLSPKEASLRVDPKALAPRPKSR